MQVKNNSALQKWFIQDYAWCFPPYKDNYGKM